MSLEEQCGYKVRDILTFTPGRVDACLLNRPTLCNPMDCRPPGSSIHGISQARILAWVGISFSRGFSGPGDQTHVSCTGRQILYYRAIWEALIPDKPSNEISVKSHSHPACEYK